MILKDKTMKKKTIEALNKLVNNYFALFAKTLGYHWNIVGCHFLEIHEHLHKIYEYQLTTLDDLAERLRILGGQAPGGASALTKGNIIKDGKAQFKWQDMLSDLMQDFISINKMLHNVANIAEKEKDLVTYDMMVKLLTDQEKELWMLRSLLEKKDK